jgi:hypothetical protein
MTRGFASHATYRSGAALAAMIVIHTERTKRCYVLTIRSHVGADGCSSSSWIAIVAIVEVGYDGTWEEYTTT